MTANTPNTNNNSVMANGTSALASKLRDSKRYYWFIVTYIVLLSAFGSFVNNMYSPALPAMCRYFGCNIPTVQTGLTTGMVGLAIGQLILGPLSDRYGRRPMLLASLIVFIIGALVSIFSPTIHFFIVCRFFQGLGASGGYFLARTIPADVYTDRGLAKLMALTGAINGIAPASAPVVGGVAADAFGWKGVFVILTLFALFIMGMAPFLKESLSTDRRTIGKWWKAFGGYKSLLKNRPFIIHISLKGSALGILFAYISSAPFVLQEQYGLSQTNYGLIIGANSLFVAVGSMLSLKFKSMKSATTVGTSILTIGTIAQALALWRIHSIYVFEICMALILFGLGLIFTTTNTLAMDEGRQNTGEASALLGVAGYIFGAIASPMVGLGTVNHATAITILVLSAITISLALTAKRLPIKH